MSYNTRFGNQSTANHAKALHNFSLVCFMCSVVIPGISVWLYLSGPDRNYTTAAQIFATVAIGSWLSVFALLGATYMMLVKATEGNHPPTPGVVHPKPSITPMYQNGKLYRLIVRVGGDNTVYSVYDDEVVEDE